MKKYLFLMLSEVSRLLSGSSLGRSLGRIPGLIQIQNLCYNLTNPNELLLIKVENNYMYVNSNDKGLVPSLIKMGRYEEYETEIFKSLIKPNTLLIDIGANIGYYSLIGAKLANEGFVYSFEPVRENFEILKKNIEYNNLNNIQAFQKAISNKNEEINIFIDGKNLGNHSLAEDNVPNKVNSQKVETISLDSFFREVKCFGNIVLKMDTQGAEGFIIEGAKFLLQNTDNISILMEFWPKGLRNMGSDPLKLLDDLMCFGFEIKLIDEKRKTLKKLNKNKIIEICSQSEEIDYVNLLLKK